MSPHGLSYMDLHRVEPEQQEPAVAQDARATRDADLGALLAIAMAFFFAGLFALHELMALLQDRSARPSLPPAAAAAFASPSAAVEDARIEGWRAGMAAGLEQGCQPPVLGMPLGAR